MMTATNEIADGSSSKTHQPRATRYEPALSEACLSWREPGEGRDSEGTASEASADPEARRLFALLLDISQTGAKIALDRIPQPGDGVWLRIGGDCVDDWTQAEVVGVTTTTLGPHLVRLAFQAPCPFETLITVICG